MKRFSDFADDRQLEGNKMPIEEAINKEVIIKSYRITDSKFNLGDKKVLHLQVEINKKNRIIFTGSQVLRTQMEKYKKELPFIAKIVKINNYYTLS